MEEEQSKDKKKVQEKDQKSASELEKYWQVVRENPADFPGWTYLLHYVEQENNIEAARDAFHAFFERYPYCYGYWKKFADMEKTLNSSESAEKVFEEGVKAIPLSVDLWIHYMSFYKLVHKDQEDYYAKVKQLFQRALDSAGHEFRSDRLWDAYVTWQEENKKLKEVTVAYDQLLKIPTQLYSHHFEKFCKHVKKNSPREILSTDEFLSLRQEVVTKHDSTIEDEDDEKVSSERTSGESLPPGVDSLDDAPPGMETSDKVEKDMMTDEQIQLMKKKIIEKRRPLHEKNEIEVGKRWSFEEGIKRPYFHVKALERAQLKNWKDYLDFEIENGVHEQVVILFERCMIACALYEDMWMKYVKYMEEKDPETAGEVYQRACKIHLPKRPTIHFSWAAYEEQRGNVEKAAEILEYMRKCIPDHLETMTRQINLERRRGNTQKVEELYTKYISEAKTNAMGSFFAIKYARYLFKVEGNFKRAREVIKEAVDSDPANPKLFMQLVDIGFQCTPIDIPFVCDAFDAALSSNMPEDQKLVFSQRKLEFLEDFGLDPQSNQKAYEDHTKRLKNYYLSSRKRTADDVAEDPEKSKKVKTEVNGVGSAATVASTTTSTSTVTTTASTVSTQDAYQYQQSPWVGYHNNNYGYHHSWSYPSSYYSTH